MSLSRRQVLRGIAGFTLALPFLESIAAPRRAGAAPTPGAKRFIQFCSQHGGIWGSNMYPGDATLVDTLAYGGRSVKRGALAAQAVGGDAVLSRVLRAPSSVLTPALVSKMNVLRGLDVPFYLGHHTGGHLGNFARNDGNGDDGRQVQARPTPTIDQIMAYSSSFYPNLATVKERSLALGSRVSYGWSNPQTRSGTIQEIVGNKDARALFKRIFVPNDDPAATALPPVVDRVLEDYKRLRSSNRRLSSGDRQRLDDHMQRLSELERRLKVRVSCNVQSVTTDTEPYFGRANYDIDPAAHGEVYRALNDVIVAAVLCDTSRIATINIDETFSSYAGDWHQDIAHHAADPGGTAQETIASAHQRMFASTFADLCAKLDVDAGNGRTYLDDSLVVWTQESGEYTHDAQGVPVITAGSAGGFLKTGNYCDYRNKAIVLSDGQQGNTAKTYCGLLWHQWLGTALQAMGVPRAEYEAATVGGYPAERFSGTFFSNNPPEYFYPASAWNVSSDVLPFLKA